VNTLTFLSKETGIDAFFVEWLDKLPHHLADGSDGDARGALDRPTVLAVVIRVTSFYLATRNGTFSSYKPEQQIMRGSTAPYLRFGFGTSPPNLATYCVRNGSITT
jgi:hypothetical protein